MITPELVAFLESGVSLLAGTRDAELRPESVRCVGARVDDDSELTLFVPAATGRRTIENLRSNGRLAACFARPIDHRTLQLKGRVVDLALARESDRVQVERYRSAFAQELAVLGMPPRLTYQLGHWPCWAVRFAVESIFDQTPGPGAGNPLSLLGAGS